MIKMSRQSVWRLALRLLGVGLAAMHGQLLWRRVADGSLTELGVGARWLASAALIGGLIVVYRRHGRLFRSREAAVLWTLVALLHAVSGVPGAAMIAEPTPWLLVPIVFLAARAVAIALRTLASPAASRALRWSRHQGGIPLRAAHAGAVGSRAPPR